MRFYPLGLLCLAHARMEIAADELDAAEADLDRGVKFYETLRRSITDERFQISFFDRSRALFAEMLRLQVRRGHGERALDYLERARARSLLDHLGERPFTRMERGRLAASTGEPLTWRAITMALPEGVSVVEYAVLDDRLLAWVLRRDRIQTIEREIPRQEIEEAVARFRAALEQPPTGEWRRISGLLDEMLLAPLRPFLQPEDLVVLVPDGVLHSVSFAALRDRRKGRYFIEDHAIAYAPSATLYLRALERSRSLGPPISAPTALAIGSPALPRRPEQNLPALPHAAAEAAEVAARLPGSKLLLGAQATRAAFFAGTARHSILHFAGHAIVKRGSQPYLLLAPAPGEDSCELDAHALFGRHLNGTRLAVLAACNTADGATAGEGVLSLARAFLAAGVPTVVASLSSVDDAEAARFLDLFYRDLAAGRLPVQAMRRAQRALLKTEPGLPPHAWATFQLIGSPL